MKNFISPMFQMLKYALVLFIAVAIAGCSSGTKDNRETGTVSGIIMLNGEPFKSVTVCLTDVASGDAALGDVHDDGTFSLTYNASPNIPCGNYKVTVGETSKPRDPMEMMKHPEKFKSTVAIPKKYQTRETTDLSVEVKPGKNDLKLELTGK